MSLRILFATHSVKDPLTAVYSNVCRRAEHLRQSGHTVDILTPDDIGIRRMSGAWPLLFGLVLLGRGRLTSYDLIVFHSHCGWAFSAVKRWVRRRVTTVTVFHGLEPLYHAAEQQELRRHGSGYGFGFRVLHTRLLPWLTRFGCRRSDAVFCLNVAERDYLVQNGWCDPARSVIVGNGVESALYTRRRHTERGKTLLFVGQWLPRKGIGYLARAFESVAARHPDLELICAGTAVSSDRVLADFDSGVRHRVKVYPRVDRPALGQLLRDADVFVFPSLFEGASGALLEAMAASLGIVASDAGAARDILADDRNALVVPSADADALAAAIDRMIADGELRDRLARAAHELAQEYEWSRVNATYSARLIDAVNGQIGQPGPAALV